MAESIIARYRELAADYPPDMLEKEGAIPPELMARMKDIGLFGLNVPEEYGGVGLSLYGYLTVLRNMAGNDMSLALTPTAHLSIGMKGILLFGDEEQKKRYLPQAASGDMIFAYALTEPGTGSDAQHIETTARLADNGSHYILNGTKTYITNGGYAGGLTVFAQMDPEKPGYMGAFIVETAWEGVKVGKELPKMGLKASSTTPIILRDVKVPVENLLGEPGDGFKIAMTILNYGRLGLGAGSTGALEQSLADMYQRAGSREQFGSPISSFELVQEKLVKARVHAFATDAMTAFTAGILEENPRARAAIESSHVKLYGTTRAWDTLYDALQVAGGAGYLSSLPYEKRMRDFRVTTVFEGTSEIHSMYPALFLLREVGKSLAGKSQFQKALYLLGKAWERPRLYFSETDPVMQKAASLVRLNARAVRRMVHMGLLRYGREMVTREYLLGRITELSMGAYSIMAAMADIRADLDRELEVDHKLELLDYLAQEVSDKRSQLLGVQSRPIEFLAGKVFKGIVSAMDKGRAGSTGDGS
jgi:acyl-CoA dehydrogenase family protein 9